MFGGEGRDQMVEVTDSTVIPADVRGEEFVRLAADDADRLAAVPADLRWEAAQGDGWTPSPQYAAWLAAQQK